jgi:hypothetical protein
MAAQDRFASYIMDATGSYTRIWPIEPKDDEDLPFIPRGVWTDTGGVIMMSAKDSPEHVLPYTMQPGVWNIVRALRIHATGTTAEGIKIGD